MGSPLGHQATRRTLVFAAMSTAGFGCPIATSAAAPSKSFKLAPFTAVSLEIAADVRIELGNSHAVTVHAGQEVLDALRVGVSGERLTVSAASYQTRLPINITISCVRLSSIAARVGGLVSLDRLSGSKLTVDLDGNAEFRARELNLGRLEAHLQGTGDMEVDGMAKEQSVELSGTGSYRGLNLRSESAVIELDGAGDVKVSASRVLDARVDGAGGVYYKLSPALRARGSNAANVFRV